MLHYNYIKAHRKRWHMTQKELAFLLGYDGNGYMSRLETGDREPQVEELILLEIIFQKAGHHLFSKYYRSVSDKLLHRLSLFEQYLCEVDATRENMRKLDEIRTVRRGIARSNNQRR